MSGRKLKSENNNTNAMNLLEIIKTNKSREKLIHCNYMYTIHKSAGVRTRWRCVARSKHCRGAVTTLRDCNNKVTSLNINIGHNHPPNLRAVEQAQLKFSLDPPIVLGKSSVSTNIKPSTSGSRGSNMVPANNNIAALQQQRQQHKQSPPATTTKQRAESPIREMQSSTTPPLVSLCQDVCLRWNSYHSNMQQSFPMLLDTEQFVDVTLACEGQFIKCHKMVLSACSSFFAELFQQNPCPHPVIVLRGSKMWEIRALVDFMYRGEVNVQQDRLASLLAAAEELQVKGLAGSTTKLPESSSPEPSFNHGGHSTDEGQKYQTTQQHKKILKRKATYPQYNEYREIRPAPPSLTKLNMQPHNFISLIPKNVEVPDNSVPNTKNIKRKSRINATRTDPENDIQTDQNTTDELVPVKEECMDYEYRARNLDEILNFNTDNSMMDNTDNNTDDDYGSNKYSEDNINRHEIDPLGVDDERNEIEENIEEAYD